VFIEHAVTCAIARETPSSHAHLFIFIYLFIQFINQQWHRSTRKEHTGRKAKQG